MAHSAKPPLACVFDLDGTLIDSAPGIANALQSAFTSIDRTASFRDIRQVIGPPVRIMAKRMDPSLSDEQAITIEQRYRIAYDQGAWQGTQAFPQVIETLQSLKAASIRLFIATNKPRLPTLRILDHLGLGTTFEDIATRDSATPNFTSKSLMLASLIVRHSLSPATTLMIGDTSEDEEASHANALCFAWVSHGYGRAAHPDYTLHHFSDLAAIVHAETPTSLR